MYDDDAVLYKLEQIFQPTVYFNCIEQPSGDLHCNVEYALKKRLQKPARAFCLNDHCCAKKLTYHLNYSPKVVRAWSTTKAINDCPQCRHALYWTKKWNIEGDREWS